MEGQQAMDRLAAAQRCTTRRNGNTCTQKHVYTHSWELVRPRAPSLGVRTARAQLTTSSAFAQVYGAYVERFPTHERVPQMLTSWVSDKVDYPEEGRETFLRTVHVSADDIPWIIRKVTGLDKIVFEQEINVDLRNRSLSMVTKNATLRKKLLCDEVCQYVVDEVNGEWTYFEQTATLSVPGMPTPVARAIEKLFIKEYEKGIAAGRDTDQLLIDLLLERAGDKLAGGGERSVWPTWSEANPELDAALARTVRPQPGASMNLPGAISSLKRTCARVRSGRRR